MTCPIAERISGRKLRTMTVIFRSSQTFEKNNNKPIGWESGETFWMNEFGKQTKLDWKKIRKIVLNFEEKKSSQLQRNDQLNW